MRKKQANTTELQRTPIKVTLLQGDTIFRHARQFHGQFKIPISTSKVQFQNYSSFEKLVRKKKRWNVYRHVPNIWMPWIVAVPFCRSIIQKPTDIRNFTKKLPKSKLSEISSSVINNAPQNVIARTTSRVNLSSFS